MFAIGDIWRFGLRLWRYGTESSQVLFTACASVLSWLANHTLMRLIALVVAVFLMLEVRSCVYSKHTNQRSVLVSDSESSHTGNSFRSIPHNRNVLAVAGRLIRSRMGYTAAESTANITSAEVTGNRKSILRGFSPARCASQTSFRKRDIGVYGTFEKGVGIDYIGYKLGAVGFGTGIGYDFGEKILEPHVMIAYNLKDLTNQWTQNTSLFLGHDLKKWIGGVRISL